MQLVVSPGITLTKLCIRLTGRSFSSSATKKTGRQAGTSKKAEPSASTGIVPKTRSSEKVPSQESEIRPAAEIHLLGQQFQDQQLLDLTWLDVLHLASVIDVGQHQATGRLLAFDARSDDAFALSHQHRTRFMQQTGTVSLVEDFRASRAIHQRDAVLLRDQKAVFAERIRILDPGAFVVDLMRHGERVGTFGLPDNRDSSLVVGDPMSRREIDHYVA